MWWGSMGVSALSQALHGIWLVISAIIVYAVTVVTSLCIGSSPWPTSLQKVKYVVYGGYHVERVPELHNQALLPVLVAWGGFIIFLCLLSLLHSFG